MVMLVVPFDLQETAGLICHRPEVTKAVAPHRTLLVRHPWGLADGYPGRLFHL